MYKVDYKNVGSGCIAGMFIDCVGVTGVFIGQSVSNSRLFYAT